jgi:cell division protein FtsI (penicillin-binding protein 3)
MIHRRYVEERVLSKKTSNQMKLFMQSVVEDEDGTGTKARIPGYSVAGKTGTAKKVINGVYEKEYIASFVGMAPSSNPKFIMAVMIDKPQGESYYGGTVAGPVFKEVMKDALKLYDIPYDRKVNKKPNNKNSQKIIEDAKL